jgi:hypothetical protein
MQHLPEADCRKAIAALCLPTDTIFGDGFADGETAASSA